MRPKRRLMPNAKDWRRHVATEEPYQETQLLLYHTMKTFRNYCRLTAILMICLFGVACSTTHEFKNKYNEKFVVKCKILSAVDQAIIPSSPTPLITSYVWIQILEPEFLKRDRVRLILKRCAIKLYDGPATDEIWHELGSIQDLTVVINKKSAECFLYPPLNVPESEANF